MTYKTPGLYIKEHNNLSSTAAIISTAVPVFIGVTHKVPDKYDIDDPELVKISGLEDYKSHFGTSPYEPSRVFIDKYQQSPIQVRLIDKNDKLSQIMYYNMQVYFNNGGGGCYILPLKASDGAKATVEQYINVLPKLEKKEDITLIVLTDAAYYLEGTMAKKLYKAVLKHCQKMKNRFVIFDTAYDVNNKKILEEFKENVGDDNLKYGAAYTPFLNTKINCINHDESKNDVSVCGLFYTLTTKQFSVQYCGNSRNVYFELSHKKLPTKSSSKGIINEGTEFIVQEGKLSIKTESTSKVGHILEAWSKHPSKGDFELSGIKEELKLSANKQPVINFCSINYFSAVSGENKLNITYEGSALAKPEVIIHPDKEKTNIHMSGETLQIECKAGMDVLELVKKIGDNPEVTARGFSVNIQNTAELDKKPKVQSVKYQLKMGMSNFYTGLISGLQISQISQISGKAPQVEIVANKLPPRPLPLKNKIVNNPEKVTFDVKENALTIKVPPNLKIIDLISTWKEYGGKGSFIIHSSTPAIAGQTIKPGVCSLFRVNNSTMLRNIKSNNSYIYNKITAALALETVNKFPPSGAVAGVYASTDRNYGVWKAPANVSLNSIVAPVFDITSGQQEDLNIDVTSGKSINVIRTFSNKGTLVWGARTLAGNDYNWRYIGVRRLFLYVESSISNGLNTFIFQANNTMTWLKVKAMIEPFLENLWQQGALVGDKAEDAFSVEIGLGKTMNVDDIQEGRMKIKVKLAVVRPTEFIEVEFSQMLQK